MRDLHQYGKTRIDTIEMQRYLAIDDYLEFAELVRALEMEGIISPIKSSKKNGKRPSLFCRYRIIKGEKDYSRYEEELKYKLNYRLKIGYYIRNIERYLQDRTYILKLSEFLNDNSKLLKDQVSLNERSFQIWGREKYLKEQGKTLLKRLGFPEYKLNYYDTTEPLAYYSYTKDIPQKIVLIENKDTYYTMRRYLINTEDLMFGENIGTLIYGAGKGINKSFRDFELSLEAYLLESDNEFLYFGDIDYEGIAIYEKLQDSFKSKVEVRPFIKAYQYMVDKAASLDFDLPDTKQEQNRNIKGTFLNYFSADYREKIMAILKADKYIPQEIISYSDLSVGGKNEA